MNTNLSVQMDYASNLSQSCPAEGIYSVVLKLPILVSGVFSCFINILFLWVVNFKVRHAFNAGAKLVLTQIGLCLLAGEITRFYVFTSSVVSYFQNVHELISLKFCTFLEIPSSVTVNVLLFSFLALLIERWLATGAAIQEARGEAPVLDTEVESEERKSVRRILGPVILGWLFAGLGNLGRVRNALATTRADLCYCSGFLYISPSVMVISMSILLLTKGGIAGALWVLIRRTRKAKAEFSIHTVTHSLDSRYTLSQSIKISEMIFPSMIIEVLCYFIMMSCTAIVFARNYGKSNIGLSDRLYLNLAASLIEIHAILHPLTCVWKNSKVRVAFLKLLGPLGRCKLFQGAAVSVGNGDDGNPYMVSYHRDPKENIEILLNLWEASRKRV